MKFIPLESEEQLQQIRNAKGYSIIFKHNTTCPISKGVQRELTQDETGIPGVEQAYLLDLWEHRNLSDAIATEYGVPHQSPQLLLICNGRCTYHEWGYDISAATTAEAVQQ
jgi:bacillithiol system protein YtxJ